MSSAPKSAAAKRRVAQLERLNQITPFGVPGPAIAVASSCAERPLLLIATTRVDDEGIWRNGLYQNVYLFYKLFNAAGYNTELFVNNPDECSKDAKIMSGFHIFDVSRLNDPSLKIHTVLEIGLNCGDQVRIAMAAHGAKLAKVYLGNIYNIDVEISAFFSNNFCHHIGGKVDRVYVSPHYLPNAEYARAINHLNTPTEIAPYIWDPYFITRGNTTEPRYTFHGPSADPFGFTIIEPNISFQKSSLIPLMIVEAFYRKNPKQVKRVTVISGDKIAANPFFRDTIMPRLQIVKDGLVDFLPRTNIPEIVDKWGSNIVVAHHVTNELNYIALEHFHMEAVYVHNSEAFADCGYYYEGNDIDAGLAAVEYAIEHHVAEIEDYRARTKQLEWKYSIYNPANIQAWRELLADLKK